MKKIWMLLLTLSLVFTFAIPASAANDAPKIVDQANLLTDTQRSTLETMAQKLVERYDMDVVILTVDSLSGKDITNYADDYFDYNGYGIGSNHSGVLLMLSMEDRDWAISTCGDAIAALTDYGQELLMDQVLVKLKDNQYYEAFRTYLTELDDYFLAYKNGEPVDDNFRPYESSEPGVNGVDIVFIIVFSLVAGLIVAVITIAIMRFGMKTTRPQRGAASYIKSGSYHLHSQKDLFLYSRTSKTRRAESSSGSSSYRGSSTHRSSSGRSHGGSSGKF